VLICNGEKYPECLKEEIRARSNSNPINYPFAYKQTDYEKGRGKPKEIIPPPSLLNLI
jgi:hypothetical protein